MKLLLIGILCLAYVFGNVEEILKKKLPPTQACPDCDVTQMPDGSLFMKKCDAYDKEKCGSDGYENYDCCVGYQVFKDKLKNQQPGNCTKVLPQWLGCLEKMTVYGVYGSLMDHVKMMEDLGHAYNKSYQTLLVADNRNNQLVPGTAQEKKEEFKFHIIEGKWYSTDLKDKQQLRSADDPEQVFHVSRLDKAIITIDCVELTEADRECESGLVHVLKKPLTHKFIQNNGRKLTLLKALQENEKSKDFIKSLTEATKKKLDTPDAAMHYTILLPTPEKWANAQSIYTDEELVTIAENHVLEKLRCLDSFYNTDEEVRTPWDQLLIFDKRPKGDKDKNKDGKIDDPDSLVPTVTARCNKVHDVVEKDVILNNGAVHMIEGPLIPDRIMKLDFKGDLPVCLEGKDVEDWWNYLKDCDLKVQKGKNYTILFPVNGALEWWKEYGKFRGEYNRFLEDKEYRCETIRYHVIPVEDEAAGIKPKVNQSIPFRTNAISNPLYQELYKAGDDLEDGAKAPVKFHYSNIIDEIPISFKDTWITRIDKINVMPEKRIIDIINEREDLSITAKLLEKTNFNKTTFAENAPKNLYLVVKNENLESVWDSEGNPVLKKESGPSESQPFNEVKARNYSLLHTIPNYLWGGDLSYFNKSTEHQFQTALGTNLTFKRDEYEMMQIGSASMKVKDWPSVVEYNIPAIDGIIWILDAPIECPPDVCGDEKLDIDDYRIDVAACRVEQLKSATKAEFKKSPLLHADKNPTECHFTNAIKYQIVEVVDE